MIYPLRKFSIKFNVILIYTVLSWCKVKENYVQCLIKMILKVMIISDRSMRT